ncbi:PIG-L family deacetylase [Candidatus Woesearchaeota archaeon]|nr:PIG-L family deacetylase [Candidatus Woesearchaeota archaeon]
MNKLFSLNKKTLFVGAHPDDIPIFAGITILDCPENSYVLTLTDGAPLFEIDYPVVGDDGVSYKNPKEYAKKRLEEDSKAFESLGVANFFNFKFSDQDLINNVSKVIEKLDSFVVDWKIEQIVTHGFPQTHPDHEVAWFASHMVAKNNSIPVWEFPNYKFDEGVCITEFPPTSTYLSFYKRTLNEDELSKKKDLLKIYSSQEGILKNHLLSVEEFGQRDFILDVLLQKVPYLSPWIRESKPEDVRINFMNFIGDQFE